MSIWFIAINGSMMLVTVKWKQFSFSFLIKESKKFFQTLLFICTKKWSKIELIFDDYMVLDHLDSKVSLKQVSMVWCVIQCLTLLKCNNWKTRKNHFNIVNQFIQFFIIPWFLLTIPISFHFSSFIHSLSWFHLVLNFKPEQNSAVKFIPIQG